MKATETRRGHVSAGRWRSMAALAVVGALLVLLAGSAGSTHAAVGGSSVSAVMVDNSSPSAAAGARTVYVVTFATSSTGGLSNAAGSQINLAFPPAGTGLGSVFGSSVDDTTTGANGVGACNPVFGQTITCFLYPGNSIAAGDSVRVTLNGVTNSPSPGSLTISVSTTSDTTPASSAPYSVVAANPISQPLVHSSLPSAAAGARTVYVVTFATSSTGGLSNAAGSLITLVFPSGTGLGSVFGSSVDDTTTGASGVGACNSPSGETITCSVGLGNSIGAGDSVRVTIDGVTNPSTPSGSLTVSVSTSSDTTPVSSAPYSVVAANKVSQPKVDNSLLSAAAGAHTVYVVTFGTSSTGGLSNAAGSLITLVFPSGAGLGSVFGSSVDDTTTGANGVGACNSPSGETITCFLGLDNSIAAGDSVRVTIKGVTNPSTGSRTISVSTTSDTIHARSAPYSVGPPPPVPGKSVDVAPVSGVVLVKRPGQNVFIRLHTGERIPLGSTVNATGGVVSLIAAKDRHGHKATGRAYRGVFRVTQRLAAGTEVTVLALAGPKPTGCPVKAASAARPHRHRAMTFRDPGDFVTVGIYARGRAQAASRTTWLTEDTCAGTLIRVAHGAVFFYDIPHHRKFLLRAGQSFLAHPGKGG